MNSTSTIETIKQWPLEDQLDLVFEVWDQIVDSGAHPKASPEWIAELQARLARHQAHPERVLTWEEIKAKLRKESELT